MENSKNNFKYNNILVELIKRNTKNQYRNSFLGMIWTVLNPLLMMGVYWLVFSQLYSDDNTFHLYLLGGQIIYQFFSTATTQSMLSIVDNAGMINRVKLPYSIYPLSNCFSALVSFGFSFVAFMLVLIVTDIFLPGLIISWSMFGLLLLLPALFAFTYGCSLVLSALYVYFRDVKHFYSVFLLLLMFISGVFYKANDMQFSGFAAVIIKCNPIYRFINYFRYVMNLSDVAFFNFGKETLIIYGAAIIMLGIGMLVFKCTKKNFILYI